MGQKRRKCPLNKGTSAQARERGCGGCVRAHRYTMSQQTGDRDPECQTLVGGVIVAPGKGVGYSGSDG